ncbi:MAG: hypothetical protein F4017_05865 [Acidimicrobiaceae bacterium]|nr:hypothetical protein [Acidimicrobiaceae bacterium]MYJ80970.1 hypothetical protein [Acidimicrobiaceae bacterium]MYK74103.1 hypothetical protein [Acidimicrobiaceae bacterium]
MKKRELMSRIRSMAEAGGIRLRLLRQGGRHEIWTPGGNRLVVPRHREINERTAEGILADARRITGQ